MLLIVIFIMGPNTNNILVKISFTRKCISKYRLQMFDHIVQVTMSTITKPGLWANVFRTASWHGNIFRVTGPLWGEFIGDRWFPSPRKQQPRLWCFLWYEPKETFEQTVGVLVISDATRRPCGVTVMVEEMSDPFGFTTYRDRHFMNIKKKGKYDLMSICEGPNTLKSKQNSDIFRRMHFFE